MKKKIPLEVLQKIQPLIEKYPDVIIPIIDASVSFKFVDADPESDFYFLMHYRNDKGKHVIKFSPSSSTVIGEYVVEAVIDDVVKYFESWVNILIGYNNLNTIFDDNAQNAYHKYYYDEFKIVDDDANYAPFDLPRIFLLEEHLENIKEFVDANIQLFKVPDVAESIKVACDELIEELTSTPKNVVMKKLTGIWAKITKSGTSLMKSFFKSFGEEFRKKLIEETATVLTKVAIEYVTKT